MGRGDLFGGPYRLGEDDDEPRVVTARSRALDAQLARLAGDGRVRAAAFIGETFGIDPVTVLAEPDPLKVLVRVAAHNLIVAEAKKQAAAR